MLGLDVAQLVEDLPSMHKAIGSIPVLHKPGMVEQACDLSTWEAEARGNSRASSVPL